MLFRIKCTTSARALQHLFYFPEPPVHDGEAGRRAEQRSARAVRRVLRGPAEGDVQDPRVQVRTEAREGRLVRHQEPRGALERHGQGAHGQGKNNNFYFKI